VLVPGMGDLRAGYRFLAPALRAAGYRARADQRQARLPPGPLELRGNEPRREDRSWLRAGLTSTGGAAQ